jgi:hypothetical protein
VLAYLSRYTHRVAISNTRLIAVDETGVTFKYKDYRVEGPGRYKTMTLATNEFIRQGGRREKATPKWGLDRSRCHAQNFFLPI